MQYESETHRCALEELDERLRRSIRTLATQHGLVDLGSTLCTRTHSERASKAGLLTRLVGLAGPESMELALLVGATHVVVARAAGDTDDFAMCAPLATLAFDPLPAEMADEGVALRGDWTRGGERSSYVVKLGDPDRAIVIDVLRRVIGARKL